MRETVKVQDKVFHPYLSEKTILGRVQELGEQITSDYKGKKPVFIGVMNGAFMFMSDLMKKVDLECESKFIKVSSYEGMESTGKLSFEVGFDESLRGKDVLIVEDIIDSGFTMFKLLEEVKKFSPSSVRVVSLLLKTNMLKADITVDYLGFSILDEFVVGYGLDYNQYGRNLKEIYQYKG